MTEKIKKETIQNPIILDYLNKKGLLDDELILNMTYDQIPSVLLMNDAQKFIDRIVELVKTGKRFLVVGDYDSDGINATSLFVRALRLTDELLNPDGAKSKVHYFIPHRFNDGYGLSEKAAKRILDKYGKNIDVVLTCDCGIRDFKGIDILSQNAEVIVTDHHIGGDQNPPGASIVVNPNQLNRTDPYPWKDITGTTVVYKLFEELAKQYLPEHLDKYQSFIDFVGVSLITDVMSVRYETRTYLKESLKVFNGESKHRLRFGWQSLIEVLTHSGKFKKGYHFTEQDFGFNFGPILNAQSRVFGEANLGVDFFLSTSTADVREKANFMVGTNEKRKEISNEAFARADEIDHSGKSVIVIRDDSLGDGFIGLVAGKITEKYNRPSVVFTESHKGVLKGSARMPEGFNLIEALYQVQDLTIGMGGHAGAAGLSIPVDNFDEFKRRLTDVMNKVIPEDLSNKTTPDIVFNDYSKCNLELLEEFQSLEPFGQTFEFPKVELKDLTLKGVKKVGKKKEHLKLETLEGFDLIFWNQAIKWLDDWDETVEKVSIVGTPGINEYNGRKTIQIIGNFNNLLLDGKEIS